MRGCLRIFLLLSALGITIKFPRNSHIFVQRRTLYSKKQHRQKLDAFKQNCLNQTLSQLLKKELKFIRKTKVLKLEENWDKLKINICLHRQSWKRIFEIK